MGNRESAKRERERERERNYFEMVIEYVQTNNPTDERERDFYLLDSTEITTT